MNRFVSAVMLAAIILLGAGCKRESNVKDRTQADEMFARICELTKEYTEKLQASPDSTDWAEACSEFEEKLDKISFSYPPDTDILLTEGQNDTIFYLMQEFTRERDRRIHGIRYPEEISDSLTVADSIPVDSAADVSAIGG